VNTEWPGDADRGPLVVVTRVLVVDGSKDARRGVVDALADLTNVTVQGAVSDLRIALEALDQCGADVVVTDAWLRDGDSVALIEAVRRHPRCPAVVVFATDDSTELRDRCLAAGVDLYLTRVLDGIAALQRGVIDVHRRKRAAGSTPPPL